MLLNFVMFSFAGTFCDTRNRLLKRMCSNARIHISQYCETSELRGSIYYASFKILLRNFTFEWFFACLFNTTVLHIVHNKVIVIIEPFPS